MFGGGGGAEEASALGHRADASQRRSSGGGHVWQGGARGRRRRLAASRDCAEMAALRGDARGSRGTRARRRESHVPCRRQGPCARRVKPPDAPLRAIVSRCDDEIMRAEASPHYKDRCGAARQRRESGRGGADEGVRADGDRRGGGGAPSRPKRCARRGFAPRSRSRADAAASIAAAARPAAARGGGSQGRQPRSRGAAAAGRSRGAARRSSSKGKGNGLQVLDEPAAAQSDATVLELQLRAVSKKQHGDVAVRSIENAAKNPRRLTGGSNPSKTCTGPSRRPKFTTGRRCLI